MGIKGLNTFIDGNPDLSKPHKLFDTKIIIDGSNLFHLLYFRDKVDYVHGGDYDKYAAAVRKFFDTFLECNISPIIVFDGGTDKSNRKYETKCGRCKNRLHLTNRLAKHGESKDSNVLPINCQEVFRNVLSEMGIPFARCDFEADGQIATLANYYKCPVLSEDSDFYIFDVSSGFIRLSSVKAHVVKTTIDGVKRKYIECVIYNIDKFLSYFPGIDRNVLPLFGTLIGNDFANARSFENFFSHIQLPKPKCKGLEFHTKQKKLVQLLIWLTHFRLEEAIDQVLSHFGGSERDELRSMIDQSVESYRTQKCNLTFVIEGDLKRLEEALKVDGTLTTQCGKALPIPFMVSFHEGKLPSLFLNVINHHSTFLSSQVEDTSLETSYTCSLYIRQVIYGFLLQHENCQDKNCCSCIEEFDRSTAGSPVIKSVKPTFTFKNDTPLPNLCDVYSMEKRSLQGIISLVLGTEISDMLSVPSNLQLIFACINYWLKNCILKPTEEFVSALVINLIYFNYILKRPLSGKSENSNASDNGMQATILAAIDKVVKADAESAAVNMKEYARKPMFNASNPLKIEIVHCYSELQTCILYSVYLNMLLGRPIEHPKLHESFSGTLLYNLTKELMSCQSPDSFVEELLGRASALSEIFSLLKAKILENVSPERVKRIKRKNKKSKSPVAKSEDVSANALATMNKFQCLSI